MKYDELWNRKIPAPAGRLQTACNQVLLIRKMKCKSSTFEEHILAATWSNLRKERCGFTKHPQWKNKGPSKDHWLHSLLLFAICSLPLDAHCAQAIELLRSSWDSRSLTGHGSWCYWELHYPIGINDQIHELGIPYEDQLWSLAELQFESGVQENNHRNALILFSPGIAPGWICGVLVPPYLNWLTDKCFLAPLGNGSHFQWIAASWSILDCNYMWYLVTVCCFFLGHNIFCRHFITVDFGSYVITVAVSMAIC